MMTEVVEIGSVPANEACAQVGQSGYAERARNECAAFVAQIRRELGQEPDGALLRVKGNQHDFGMYYEVVCWFDPSKPAAIEYAFMVEEKQPAQWDRQSLFDLGLVAFMEEEVEV